MAMADLDQLIASVALMLENRPPPTENALRKLVDAQAAMLAANAELTGAGQPTSEELATAVRTIMTRFSIRMELGSMFKGENYRPWLTNRQGQIDWYYWKRYRKHLLKKGFPPHVVTTLDLLTDKIVDHLEDPLKDGAWARKGLVVGHVQSGKTATQDHFTYIGTFKKGTATVCDPCSGHRTIGTRDTRTVLNWQLSK
jgi:hypothetical protein